MRRSALLSPFVPADQYRAVTAARMRALDREAMERFGLPGAVLMENAGRAAAECALRLFKGPSAAIFCGGGNNGGDGLAAARHLANAGWKVRVVLARPPARYAGDALCHWKIARAMKISYMVFQNPKKLLKFIGFAPLLVDALLGTGAQGPLREPYRALISLINDLRRPVLAVDVPSGLDADTGEVVENAVRARATVTMALPKKGLLKRSAHPWVGRLLVADIGFPKNLTDRFRK